jgi:NAD(P)-dependent dehydrogenase (short-subunit alcohol dehydrogenase family)
MPHSFAGRHVVVTGAAGALGFSVVKTMVESGATCHAPVREKEHTDALEALDRKAVRVVRGIDPTVEADVQRFYAELPDLWASIHCVGGFAMGPAAEFALADMRRLFDGNFTSAFLCSRFAVKRMQADKRGGRIVNVAARVALEPRGGARMAAYAASKAAVVAFTQALSEEVAADGILVNAVAPSIMDTPANRASMPQADFSRWPKTEEVAAVIAFLASNDNQLVRGGVAPVYGRS